MRSETLQNEAAAIDDFNAAIRINPNEVRKHR